MPTVVIGKYQTAQAEVNLPYPEENGIALMHRHSGDGTIYSDSNNLMFSIVTHETDEGMRNPCAKHCLRLRSPIKSGLMR